MFHLINFFQKIFHIMYLNFMGANNGVQDSMCHLSFFLQVYQQLIFCVKGNKFGLSRSPSDFSVGADLKFILGDFL